MWLLKSKAEVRSKAVRAFRCATFTADGLSQPVKTTSCSSICADSILCRLIAATVLIRPVSIPRAFQKPLGMCHFHLTRVACNLKLRQMFVVLLILSPKVDHQDQALALPVFDSFGCEKV